jgi:hypothetical protein
MRRIFLFRPESGTSGERRSKERIYELCSHNYRNRFRNSCQADRMQHAIAEQRGESVAYQGHTKAKISSI